MQPNGNWITTGCWHNAHKIFCSCKQREYGVDDNNDDLTRMWNDIAAAHRLRDSQAIHQTVCMDSSSSNEISRSRHSEERSHHMTEFAEYGRPIDIGLQNTCNCDQLQEPRNSGNKVKSIKKKLKWLDEQESRIEMKYNEKKKKLTRSITRMTLEAQLEPVMSDVERLSKRSQTTIQIHRPSLASHLMDELPYGYDDQPPFEVYRLPERVSPTCHQHQNSQRQQRQRNAECLNDSRTNRRRTRKRQRPD